MHFLVATLRVSRRHFARAGEQVESAKMHFCKASREGRREAGPGLQKKNCTPHTHSSFFTSDADLQEEGGGASPVHFAAVVCVDQREVGKEGEPGLQLHMWDEEGRCRFCTCAKILANLFKKLNRFQSIKF